MKETEEKVIAILQEYVAADTEIGRDSRLAVDLDMSSLDLVNIVVDFEDAFGVEVPDRDIWGFTTVGDVVQWLEAHV